jgi:hypothetical protein
VYVPLYSYRRRLQQEFLATGKVGVFEADKQAVFENDFLGKAVLAEGLG